MEDKVHKRVCFLDYDGVVNTPMWNEKGTNSRYYFPSDGKVNNFQAVQWLSEACKKFHYDIVVTSTWRSKANYKECLINGGLRDGIEVLGRTEDLHYEHPYPEKTRGWEIKKYLEEHPEIEYYVIVDDENQFLPEQQHHFIHIINDWTGFGYLEYAKWEEIYLKDLGHKSSHWLPKEPPAEPLGVKVDEDFYLDITEPVEQIIFVTEHTRNECEPDYILAHDGFTINGVKYRKVKDE